MGRYKRFTVQELALFYGVHRNTMAKILRSEGVDLADPVSVLRFVVQKGGDFAQEEMLECQISQN